MKSPPAPTPSSVPAPAPASASPLQLSELKIGQAATIRAVGGEGALRQHFLDMGVIPGANIALVKFAPMGDPMEFLVQGYELTLRVADARKILVDGVCEASATAGTAASAVGKAGDQPCAGARRGAAPMACGSCALGASCPAAALAAPRPPSSPPPQELPHPRLGEEHITRADGPRDPVLPEGTKLVFALAGNQNSGKTTLFNALTGANQHVGNFPGVTVDRKSGAIKGHPDTEVVDLPGIYSLSPYSSEEVVSRAFILDEKPTALINIVDATNIERNLYLTMQLLELDVPTVIAVNMMDELTGNGGLIRINEMEELLGVPVVPISAVKHQGTTELVNHALHVARYAERPRRNDFCDPDDHSGAVHRAIHGVMELVADHAERAGIPPRFAASKLIEGDPLVEAALKLDENEKDLLGHIVRQLEQERGLDRAAAVADMRFAFIRRLCAQTVVRPRESREHERSRRIDRVLTGKWTAIPIFVLIMLAVFYLTFNVVGLALQNALAAGIGALSAATDAWLAAAHVAPAVHSLVIDALFGGVGTVVSFVPIILVLFFFLSLMEDSGYMARAAFVMDKLLRKIGLSGRSIVPLLVGFGCSVPAAMATRTLPSRRDRRMTTLLIPFMSCSAKMPVYAFFTAAFFPRSAMLVTAGLYFGGILAAVLVALFTKNTLYRGEAVPFVMELPNYRLPALSNVLRLMWDKAKDFLQRAFTVILVATVLVWFLQGFGPHLTLVADPEHSILAALAGWLAPVFRPLGLGDWRIVTALISGFMAKESIVSMMQLLYGATTPLAASLTTLQASVFLVFCLLYTPCVAAVAAIRRERGTSYALWSVLFQCAFAWLAALLLRWLLPLFL